MGVDEVGRGALAGPLVVCVCALREDAIPDGIDDSKRLSPARRAVLVPRIEESAIVWGIGEASPSEIDRLGITEALRLAARRASDEALARVDGSAPLRIHYLVDGPIPLFEGEAVTPLVKGDSISASIAAASILAKVYRDTLMVRSAEKYPEYAFDSHKGYATPAHLEALYRYGPSPIHRKSFYPVAAVISKPRLWDSLHVADGDV